MTFSLPVPTRLSSTDLSLLLDCIAEVESRRDDKAISYRGGQPVARGRYQLSSSTWFQHTNRPWTLAHSFFISDEIAKRHMGWLESNLPRISIAEYHFRPWSLAWCWRGGLDAFRVRSTFPDSISHQYDDYANRVTNLYSSLRSEQTTNHPPK
jgi:hypothetical protein